VGELAACGQKSMTRNPNRRHAGQVMVEFLLVSSALALALFFPYLDGCSVASLLVHALMESFRARSFLISIF
jgi:hypothetical protein